MKKPAKQPANSPGRLLLAGGLALVAAYIFASLAIDRGNWLYYGLAFASLYFAGRYLWRGILTTKK